MLKQAKGNRIMAKKNWKWCKGYGDGEETDDLVLWVNKNPTETIISPISSKCFVAYKEGKEIGVFDTKTQAKKVLGY